MDELLDVAAEFFERDGWPSIRDEDGSLLQLPVTTRTGSWTCLAQSFEADRRFVFYSVCPLRAPSAKLRDVAEFLTRANYGLVLGNFEMDWCDGEVRFKTSVDVGEGPLTPTLVAQMAYANVRIVGRHLPGLAALIEQDLTPEQAAQMVEDVQTDDVTVDLTAVQERDK